MKVLLDTHALLWWLFPDARLSAVARDVIADARNEVFVSSATAWEIGTKYRLGKLASAALLVQDIAGFVSQRGFRPLPISLAHAQRAGSWPHPHRDPFDRLIAAQSEIEAYPVVTRDPVFKAFGVSLIW